MTDAPSPVPPAPVGRHDAVRCHDAWLRDDLPAWGTAARALFWVALEVPGPWGRTAATESHLDPEFGQWLDQWCSSRGGRLVLVRRPGRHADAHHMASRTLLIASSLAGRPWLGGVEASDPDELRARLDALGDQVLTLTADRHPDWLADQPGALLVCTNAKRDQCCALVGRPIAAAVEQLAPGRVWECSHLGGHRFAPTVLALPTGQVFGRVGVELAEQVLADLDAGVVSTTSAWHDRGRSHLPPADQVADIAVRLGLAGTPVQVDAGELPESCGKSAVPVSVWRLDAG
ncbi:sucrase ferredoxin [Aestuariimicrobium ganziense]|uniref:sucrase ferredoxin n=1 Tax=Aestuariimicrobium ganziense TaxID=2773677 RepID=UPI001944DB19|nr:sucrase ferredoxin [Aestuariimicrobium ganziense]